MSRKRLLLIDDEAMLTETFKACFEGPDTEISVAQNGKEGLELLVKKDPDVVITDYKMPEMDGLAFLEAAKSVKPDTPVIILTGHSDKDTHLQFLKQGAYRYLEKPFQFEELKLIAQAAIYRRHLIRDKEKLENIIQLDTEFPEIIGESPPMKSLFQLISKVAKTDATVLVQGETGTGKELIAQAIHQNSPRKDKPFIRFNCAALSETLIESELFGYEKGAFTGADQTKLGRFELANGGTLFFDEIGELSLNMQVKLLRAIQEREFERVGGTTPITVDVRFIAATNKDLERMSQEGTFREDLFYRLNSFPIPVPPLRNRGNDIRLLITHFVEKFSRQNNIPVKTFSQKSLQLLQDYNWKGNIRELQNIVARSMILCEGDVIEASYLPFFNFSSPSIIDNAQKENLTEEELVSLYAKQIYQKCDYNKKETARILNINFRTLVKRLNYSPDK